MAIALADRAFTGYFPLPNGRFRVLGTVPEGLEGKETLTFEDVAHGFAERTGMDVKLQDPEWISTYRSHHRVVSTFRKGRSFLAGDAAHIHSPVGAQGMNTGLQDAYNLGWKLALVAQGRAHEELLDTYNDERLSIAQSLVKTTDRAFQYVNTQNPVLETFRMNLMPRLIPGVWSVVKQQRAIRELGFKTISEIGINYRASKLSQEGALSQFPRYAPKPGDRVPYLPSTAKSLGTQDMVSGTRFHLVLFLGDATDQESHELAQGLQSDYPYLMDVNEILLSDKTKRLYRTFGILNRGCYVIRPDSYITFRSSSFDAEYLHQHLQQFFG
jgi:hypothetical protein